MKCYIRDAQGNVLAVYELKRDSLQWSEQHLYGSARLGLIEKNVLLNSTKVNINKPGIPGLVFGIKRNARRYELTNHLGNVLSVISDVKRPKTESSNIYYDVDRIAVNDYYPLGMQMPGRKLSQETYRYGFNGKENDNEVKGEGNQQDYGMRIYDPRVGRFLSVDPLEDEFPEWSAYQYVKNSPILRIDVDGRWDVEVHAYSDRKKYGKAILIVRNRSGDEVFRTLVRVNGSKSLIGKARNITYGDTPTGNYEIIRWQNKAVNGDKDRISYGPNDILRLKYLGGEGGKRQDMHIHGGQQEKKVGNSWVKVKNPTLKNTHGCFRILDDDIVDLKQITEELEKNDPLEKKGNLTLADDLQLVKGKYILKEKAEQPLMILSPIESNASDSMNSNLPSNGIKILLNKKKKER